MPDDVYKAMKRAISLISAPDTAQLCPYSTGCYVKIMPNVRWGQTETVFFETKKCYNAVLTLEGKIMRKVAVILSVACLLSMYPVVFAGGLIKANVDADANWVVHADVEKFKETKIASIIDNELKAAGVYEQLDFFKSVFSFNPVEDIKSITIYGKGQDEANAVVIIKGNFDMDVLENLIRQNPYYEEKKHGKYVLHSWIDEKKVDQGAKRQFGTFHNKDILLGAGADSIGKALDVLDGKARNARQKGLFKALKKSDKNAFIVAAASGVGKITEQWEQAMMLKHTKESSLKVGESEGNVYIDLSLQTSSSQTAEELTQLIQGIIAFLNLAGQEQPQIAQLASSIKVTTRKNTVRVHFEHDIDKIYKFVKDEWEKKQLQEAEKAIQQVEQGK